MGRNCTLYSCCDGMILPIINESDWGTGTRAILYLVGLLYSFLGVAIAADIFMCSIERITSKKRKIKLVRGDDKEDAPDDASVTSDVEFLEVAVWNPTVANLTLMALGSSAPEILLSCIEILGNEMEAGKLGPSTIVGSAAFNLFCITAICIVVVPTPDTRRIRALTVFAVTASFSIFAYIWLLIILVASTPNEIEIWEAFMTLFWFAVLIGIAFLADKKFFVSKFRKGAIEQPPMENGLPTAEELAESEGVVYRFTHSSGGNTLAQQKEWAILQKEVAMQYPTLSPEQIAKIVATRVRSSQRHDRLYYRISATRWLDGRRTALSDRNIDYSPKDGSGSRPESATGSMTSLPRKGKVQQRKCKIEFSSKIYGFDGESNLIRIKLVRRGRSHKKVTVRYETQSGSAMKLEHFLPKAETIIFQPNELEKTITLEILPNVEWKNMQGFYVQLHLEGADSNTKIGTCHPAMIRYSDSKDEPAFEFANRNFSVKESTGVARLPVRRAFGRVDSQVKIQWGTKDVTANDGRDFEGGKGELIFEPGDVEKFLDIPIIDDMEEEKAETFEVTMDSISEKATLADSGNLVTVTILSDDSIKEMFLQLDELIPSFIDHWEFGASTWRQQLLEAISVNDGDIKEATWRDMIMHVICFPFKAVFALVPPTVLFGGWLTFFVSLVLIGFLTAIIGDLASIFGCIIGLKPSITAITFVALGTSLPDTFASKIAAVEDPTADNSIGNITGSNSVNVFLGLGVPWFIASIYWAAKGKNFPVPAESLVFTVTIFTMFAVICIALLMVRRMVPAFGRAELGGPHNAKYASAGILVALWVLYVLLSALQVYDVIDGF